MINRSSLHIILILCFCIGVQQNTRAQISKKNELAAYDTIPMIMLDTVTIEERQLKNFNYNRYAYIVNKVYPYADTAVTLLNDYEEKIKTMNKGDIRRYRKETEKALKSHFEDRLKNMGRSEGEVLIAIIERNTNRDLYSILKEVKSGSTAFWWNNVSKLYGYDLKDKYDPQNDPTLEMIIADYEIRHHKN